MLRGSLGARAQVEKCAYLPGEMVAVAYSAANRSAERVRAVRVLLHRTLRMRGPGRGFESAFTGMPLPLPQQQQQQQQQWGAAAPFTEAQVVAQAVFPGFEPEEVFGRGEGLSASGGNGGEGDGAVGLLGSTARYLSLQARARAGVYDRNRSISQAGPSPLGPVVAFKFGGHPIHPPYQNIPLPALSFPIFPLAGAPVRPAHGVGPAPLLRLRARDPLRGASGRNSNSNSKGSLPELFPAVAVSGWRLRPISWDGGA